MKTLGFETKFSFFHSQIIHIDGLSIENKFQANKRIYRTWMLLHQPYTSSLRLASPLPLL
ncbi:MAG: hypothetical protein CLLPBCKN_006414 [Chroococcidiopsis cubana SAG 39.79]|nr:hypothetical protein [Chroococcidiopsis cubana SAG 39.79]